MIETSVIVERRNGLDGRPIAMLVQEASQYVSQIYIMVKDKKINAKSIMGMMSLSFAEGEELTVVTDGSDEAKAAEGMSRFFAVR